MLRLGKKVIANNPKAGSFEFGVVVITEVGKERKNNLELTDVKGKAKETNQKNDLFNVWLKMCRHAATVDNFPFIKVITDEQRAESWGSGRAGFVRYFNHCGFRKAEAGFAVLYHRGYDRVHRVFKVYAVVL